MGLLLLRIATMLLVCTWLPLQMSLLLLWLLLLLSLLLLQRQLLLPLFLTRKAEKAVRCGIIRVSFGSRGLLLLLLLLRQPLL